MKKNLKYGRIKFYFFIIVSVLIVSCNKKPEQGNAMQTTSQADINLNDVIKPTNNFVLSTVKTIKPQYNKIALTVNANGFIDYDTRTFDNIASRYEGRIEKLYIKYNFQPIKKGEKIFEIYSPEIVTAQQNLLYILINDSANSTLINAAENKLLLLGITTEQLNEIKKNKKIISPLPVYSPVTGHIHEMNAMMPGSKMLNDLANAPLSVKEGMYVKKGETIFQVVNPYKVWAVLKIYADDVSKIKIKQPVELSFPELPDMKMQATINFIEPVFQPDSKILNARVYLDNMEHQMKIGSLVYAKISADSIQGLWIPSSAVLDKGFQKIIFLKMSGVFQARTIETGIIQNNLVQITSNLSDTAEIAADAHYLTDSESFIKINTNENN